MRRAYFILQSRKKSGGKEQIMSKAGDLREKTGEGIAKCKKALEMCGENSEVAEEYLRLKGQAVVRKKNGTPWTEKDYVDETTRRTSGTNGIYIVVCWTWQGNGFEEDDVSVPSFVKAFRTKQAAQSYIDGAIKFPLQYEIEEVPFENE